MSYLVDPRANQRRPPRWEGPWLLLIPAVVIGFVLGLFVNVEATPNDPPTGFVNVEGHEGEVLVVGEDGDLRWCMKADLGCHGG